MALHWFRLHNLVNWANRAVKFNHLNSIVYGTTDLLQALDGADYIFLMFDQGGLAAYDTDYQITRKYGIDLCIGDTMNPTGIMKALRNITVLQELSSAMLQVCPDALCINYVNPMSVFLMAADRFGIKRAIGLCGGVDSTKQLISDCLQVPLEQLQFSFAGINHMCWALEIASNEGDLYPVFKKNMSRPEWISYERVRFDVLQHFNYFVTESSGHLSDMLPWFRRDSSARDTYCNLAGYQGASGAYRKYVKYLHKRLKDIDHLESEFGMLEPIDGNSSVRIIEAVESRSFFQFYGNGMNTNSTITNLPQSACIEALMRCEGGNINFVHETTLPVHLAMLIKGNVAVHELILEAVVNSDPELVMAAVAMDPLSQSVLSLSSARSLARELLDANVPYLSGFSRKKLRSSVAIPSGYNSEVPKNIKKKRLFDILKNY